MSSPSSVTLREQRAAARFGAYLPVRIDGCTGVTLDIANHGIYFVTAQPRRVGSLVEFTLEYRLHGRKQQLQCEAKVLRVERRGPRYGVAARMLAPFFAGQEAATSLR